MISEPEPRDLSVAMLFAYPWQQQSSTTNLRASDACQWRATWQVIPNQIFLRFVIWLVLWWNATRFGIFQKLKKLSYRTKAVSHQRCSWILRDDEVENLKGDFNSPKSMVICGENDQIIIKSSWILPKFSKMTMIVVLKHMYVPVMCLFSCLKKLTWKSTFVFWSFLLWGFWCDDILTKRWTWRENKVSKLYRGISIEQIFQFLFFWGEKKLPTCTMVGWQGFGLTSRLIVWQKALVAPRKGLCTCCLPGSFEWVVSWYSLRWWWR